MKSNISSSNISRTDKAAEEEQAAGAAVATQFVA